MVHLTGWCLSCWNLATASSLVFMAGSGVRTHMLGLQGSASAPDGRVLVLLGPDQRPQLGAHARARPLQLLQRGSLHIVLYTRQVTGSGTCTNQVKAYAGKSQLEAPSCTYSHQC